jgi:hypothetical protein
MGSLIRRALALFACVLVAASWTTVLAQQGVDADQIAISAAANVCVSSSDMTQRLIPCPYLAKSVVGNVQTPTVSWRQSSPAEELDDWPHVVWTERLQGISR